MTKKIDPKDFAVVPPEPVERIEVSSLVASPFHAPREYQSTAPVDAYPSTRWAPVGNSTELDRIIGLKRREPLDLLSPRAEALADMMTARWSRGPRACRCAEIDVQIALGKRQCLTRLKPVQAWALYELGITGGLLGAIVVGGGKTLLGVMAPMALVEYSAACRNVLLLVPPNLMEQLQRDYLLIAEHFDVPSIKYHDGKSHPGIDEMSGRPMLHVLPYSRLSLPKSSAWVRNLNPDAIIADEADRLRDPNSAGTSRILRQFFENGRTLFACWTGSLTDRSLSEYYHLAALALRYGSPVPLDKTVTEEWGRAIDASSSPAPPGELLRLCAPGESVHEGYRRRLTETMGVVVSTVSSSTAELHIFEREAPAIPQKIADALHMLRTTWVRPDTWAGADYDEELVDAMQVAKCASELACGLFYRWIFPRGEPKPLVEEWFLARKDWNCELRDRLKDRKEHLDSPMLCEHAAQRAWGDRPNQDDLPEWKAAAWPRWRAVKTSVKPKTEGVRGDPFLAQDAADWARENRGIVWYGMVELGTWIAELSGCSLHGGGPKAGKRISAETGERSIVASIKSHGRGRDGLQRLYNDQLIANPPANASGWEQLLGRLDRQGQSNGDVSAAFYRHTPELKGVVDQALRRAAYVEGTLGLTQKLRMGFKV